MQTLTARAKTRLVAWGHGLRSILAALREQPGAVFSTMAKQIKALIPTERIDQAILLLRGQKVMLDFDLAALYEVQTKVLNQAVKRNRSRFPEDFMFQLSKDELAGLKSQIVTSSWGGRRTPPYAFTEQGVAMLSSVLHSERAVSVNIEIMRAFVRLREILAGHAELARRLDELEQKYDKQFAAVFDAIRQLMAPPIRGAREIGYHTLVKRPREVD